MMNDTSDPEPSSENGDAHIHVRVDHDFKREIRVAAARKDLSISDYVRELLRDDVNNSD